MRCEEVKSKVRSFLEDLLPEAERFSVREHLRECSKCRQMSQGLGFFSSDLKKIAEIPIADSLKSSVLSAFNTGDSGVFVEPQEARDNGLWGAVVVAIFFACAILGAGYFLRQESQKKIAIKDEASKISEKKPLSSDEASSSTAQPTKVLPVSSIKRSIFLRPLHWDLYFPSTPDKNRLRAQIRGAGAEVLFENSGLAVLSLDNHSLKNLMNAADALGGTFKGGGSVLSVHPPPTDGEFRISLSLNAPESSASQALTHHWHIQFQLPNRFTLKENIQGVGAKFIYEAPEIWVVEIPGPDVEKLKTMVQETHGIALNIKDDSLSTEYYDNVPVSVSFYIEEG